MAPRRAAAVSAATSISNAAAGPSKAPTSTPTKGDVSAAASKQGRASQGGQNSKTAPAGVVLPLVPTESLSPIISRLRKMWKFAAVCQFLFTFDEAFGMSGFETEALERDLDGTETKVIPDLMRRLLYTLTLNRSVDEYNWEEHLRSQYLARHPDDLILGTIEEPFPWAGLPLRLKVETLHQACEWQLWDAERFRKLVKNEEEAHIWRIDPVGWDSKNNTYWLFDDNRLWLQHPRPEPVKAKAPPKKSSKKAKQEAAAAKRAAAAAQKRKREDAKPKSTPTRSSTRNRSSSGYQELPPLKRGRTSGRSTARGDWEEIPSELLYAAEEGEGDDAESELSDPPSQGDEDVDVSMLEDTKVEDSGGQTADASVMEVDDSKDEHEANGINGNKEDEENKAGTVTTEGKVVKVEEEEEWIEFETVAVSKQEWEAMSTVFAKSKHPDEKAFHQFLQTEVLPKVMADIAEEEKQRAHEAAMANRKRSSRIALKESEREEKERDRVARLKMEEKMAAIRAEEAQKLVKEKEEQDMAKVREERLREREERLAAREREAFERAEREIMERENRERMREMRKLKREQMLANGGMPLDSDELQQHKEHDDDSWELDCEVCGKSGINLDDTDEIVCCEKCAVWQHTECWNVFDRLLGRPARDWEKEDFYCSKCKPPGPGEPWPPAVARRREEEAAASSAPVQPASALSSAGQSTAAANEGLPAQKPVDIRPPTHLQAPAPRPVQTSMSPVYSPYNAAQGEQPYSTQHASSQALPSQPQQLPQQPLMQSTQRPMQAAPPVTNGFAQYKQHQPPLPVTQQVSVPPQHMQRPPPQGQSMPRQAHFSASLPSAQPTQPSSVNGSRGDMSAPKPSHTQARPLHAASPTPALATSVKPSPPILQPQGSFGLQGSTVFTPGAPSATEGKAPLTPSAKSASSPGSTSNVPSNTKVSPGVQRQASHQPSGSFPLRHTMAKSPLSRPEGYISPSVPSISLGPSVARATSPSAARMSPSSKPKSDPLLDRQSVPLSGASISSNASSGPGPSSGSLARAAPATGSSPSVPSVSARTLVSTPAPAPPQDQSRPHPSHEAQQQPRQEHQQAPPMSPTPVPSSMLGSTALPVEALSKPSPVPLPQAQQQRSGPEALRGAPIGTATPPPASSTPSVTGTPTSGLPPSLLPPPPPPQQAVAVSAPTTATASAATNGGSDGHSPAVPTISATTASQAEAPRISAEQPTLPTGQEVDEANQPAGPSSSHHI